uniref:Secreted protein n=1 Tax=Setaria viridis TaxID=4556 RepID=A0A4U6UG40_SETVI|nr:hypothetical protein SEVIR_6G093700v2 [Setaria viridis]
MKTCMVLFLSWKTLNLCMASKILSLILVSPGRSPFLDPPLAWRKGEQEVSLLAGILKKLYYSMEVSVLAARQQQHHVQHQIFILKGPPI